MHFTTQNVEGSKCEKSFHWVLKKLRGSAADVDTAKMWVELRKLVVKTLLSMQPWVVQAYQLQVDAAKAAGTVVKAIQAIQNE